MIDIKLIKTYPQARGDFKLDIELSLEEGTCLMIYGPSGAGKTSLLRMMAGLSKPDAGKIQFGNTCFYDAAKGFHLKARKRGVAMVFQDYALFPNMTAMQNMRYAMTEPADEAYLQHLIDVMDLSAILDQKAPSLSGGQQQRVALARALLSRTKLLLLDEALSALDQLKRCELQSLLKEITKKEGLSCMMVSHDLEEIHTLADQVLMLDNGKQKAFGKASDLFASGSAEDGIQLKARVLDIQTEQGKHFLKLLVKDEIYSLEVQDISSYKIGDELRFSLSSEQLLD